MISKETLSTATKRLIFKQPFYGYLALALDKNWCEDIPTAGVTINDLRYRLSVNHTFWSSLTSDHQIGLLQHEIMHIAFFHLTDDYDAVKFPHRDILNIAMDLEINQYISPEMLPPGGMVISLFPELNLEAKRGTRYYYEKLVNSAQSCSSLQVCLNAMGEGEASVKLGDKQVNLPNHEFDGQVDNMTAGEKKILKNQTGTVLVSIADETLKSQGTIPGEFSEILKILKNPAPAVFNWKGYLRRFVGKATEVDTKLTRRKPSKRIPGFPAVKIKRRINILVGIDTSGSVSTNELKEFQSELYHLQKCGHSITIIQCDYSIQNISKFNHRKPLEIHGRGGTSFDPVCSYFKEHDEFSCLIYFTDGECSPPREYRVPLLWIISSVANGRAPELPGQIIHIPQSKI